MGIVIGGCEIGFISGRGRGCRWGKAAWSNGEVLQASLLRVKNDMYLGRRCWSLSLHRGPTWEQIPLVSFSLQPTPPLTPTAPTALGIFDFFWSLV